jgi:hypothetical protein
LISFHVAENGRNGYPGPKGQRGEHGVEGPNVNDKRKKLSNFYYYFFAYIDLWHQTNSTTSWTTRLSSKCWIFSLEYVDYFLSRD